MKQQVKQLVKKNETKKAVFFLPFSDFNSLLSLDTAKIQNA